MPPDQYRPPATPVSISYATGDFSRYVHPWLFLVLMIPFGASSGYVSVTLGALLEQGGVSVKEVAALLALSVLPHTLKFLWSPVVDVTLTPKKWYLLSALPTAGTVALLGAYPANTAGLGALSVVAFMGGLMTTVLGMTVDSLMAHCTADELKGRAGGWAMAGNLGGSGIGGGLGLLIAVRVPEQWMASGFIGLLCALCCLALCQRRRRPGLKYYRGSMAGLHVPCQRFAMCLAAAPRT